MNTIHLCTQVIWPLKVVSQGKAYIHLPTFHHIFAFKPLGKRGMILTITHYVSEGQSLIIISDSCIKSWQQNWFIFVTSQKVRPLPCTWPDQTRCGKTSCRGIHNCSSFTFTSILVKMFLQIDLNVLNIFWGSQEIALTNQTSLRRVELVFGLVIRWLSGNTANFMNKANMYLLF